jgi:hypothetical protein
MSRIVCVLIALVFAVPALSQSREDGPAVEICTMNPVGHGVPDGLDPASDRFRSPDRWTLCPDCPAPTDEGVQPLAPADGEMAVLFRPGGAPLAPFARPVERDCQSYDLGVVPFIAPHPSADAEWTLEESRRRLEARYCPYDTEDGKLCLSFVCTPEEEQWMLLAEGSVEGLDVTEALELELDVRVDGALAGYLTLSARAGFENAFFAVYVRQLDDELLGALRRGQAGTFRVRAMKQERELGMTLDGSSRALGAVLGNCGDLQRLATPDTAPDRFVLLNGPSTEAAIDAARQALDDRIGRLLALEGAPDPDVRRAVAVQLPDGWRFVDALVGPSPELGYSNFARYFLVKPPNRDWVVFDPVENPPRIYIDRKRPIGAWPNLLLTTAERDLTIYERWYWDGSNYLYRETIPQ